MHSLASWLLAVVSIHYCEHCRIYLLLHLYRVSWYGNEGYGVQALPEIPGTAVSEWPVIIII